MNNHVIRKAVRVKLLILDLMINKRKRKFQLMMIMYRWIQQIRFKISKISICSFWKAKNVYRNLISIFLILAKIKIRKTLNWINKKIQRKKRLNFSKNLASWRSWKDKEWFKILSIMRATKIKKKNFCSR